MKTEYRSMLNRSLPTSLPITEASPIGTDLMTQPLPANATLLSAETKGKERFEYFELNHSGRVDLVRETFVPAQSGHLARVVLENPTGGERRVYLSDVGADGKPGPVHYYTEVTPKGSLTVSDGNRDGNADWRSESLSRLPGVKPELEAGWRADHLYNRVLQDADHNGTWDQEGFTGEFWRQIP